jgi:hypothetical protein
MTCSGGVAVRPLGLSMRSGEVGGDAALAAKRHRVDPGHWTRRASGCGHVGRRRRLAASWARVT